MLRSEGLIRTERGRASFVRRPAEQAHTHTRALVKAAGRYRDTETNQTAGYSLVAEPATYEMPATPALARAFGIVEGTPIFGYDRLLANRAGTRLYRVTYLPASVAARHEEPDRQRLPRVCRTRRCTWRGHGWSVGVHRNRHRPPPITRRRRHAANRRRHRPTRHPPRHRRTRRRPNACHRRTDCPPTTPNSRTDSTRPLGGPCRPTSPCCAVG